jgi:hypothetical protein
MSKDCPAPAKDGNIGTGVKGTENSLISNGTSFLNNFENCHKWEVYVDVANHEWTTVGQTCDRLGYYDGRKENLRHRRMISDVFKIFTVFKVFRKEYHRYIVTRNVPRAAPATRQERVFDSQGMPRVQPKSTANCPQYAHPEAAGGDGE